MGQGGPALARARGLASRLSASSSARGALLLTGAGAMGRFLVFVYYVIAARALDPAGFGEVRYTISLAVLAFGPLQVIATALSRDLGATRSDPHQQRIVLGSSVVVGFVVFLLTLVLAAIGLVTGAAHGTNAVGLFLVLGGMALSALYAAMARGVGDIRRAALVDFGSSLLQLVALAVLMLATAPSATGALIVFSLSGLLPILLYEARRPLLLGRGLRASRDAAGELLRLAWPLLGSQFIFLVWSSADQVWVSNSLSKADLGVYGVAKTLVMVFVVLPNGINGMLLPRAAELRAAGRGEQGRRLMRHAALVIAAAGLVLSLIVAAFSHLVLELVYGPEYTRGAMTLLALAVGMLFYGPFQALVIGGVAWGRPHLTTLGVAAAAAVEVPLLLLFAHDMVSAAIISTTSNAVGLLVVLLRLRLAPLADVASAQED